MKELLKKYLEIELTGSLRAKRTQLHLELVNSLTNSNLTFEDISVLLAEAKLKKVKIRQPLFEKIIYPILQKEIDENNLQAIKWLIKLEGNLLGLQARTKEYKLTKRLLLLKGLEINSNDKELLEIYESDLRNYLEYTIHEVPSGVLYDMNGANEIQCNELLEVLNDYKEICNKLALNRNELINECQFHFQNYKNYLQKCNDFASYSNFLKRLTETV